MDGQEFKDSTKTVSEMIVDYMEKVPFMSLANKVRPGFLENELEDECPSEGSHFVTIKRDFEQKILNGISHRVSPHFHSDIPMGNSYASMVAEILIAGLNNVSLNWEASPAATELEVIVLNWLVEMLNLPKYFKIATGNSGGGVLQNTGTESILLSLLSARTRAIDNYRNTNDKDIITDDAIIKKLVFYSSNLAKTTCDLVSKITTIKVRHLVADADGKINASTLKMAFEEDVSNDLIPLMYVSSMDTNTLICFDDLAQIGPICQKFNVWLHIDAENSGMALICPEMRSISKGVEYADSIAVGLHNLLMSQDVVAYWIKEGVYLTSALNMDPLYLRHKHVGNIHDYMNWQIGTGRKFKALKVWITLKSFGLEGMQVQVRKQIKMAMKMEELVQKDNRFDLVARNLGLVSFRLKSEQENDSQKLLERINQNGKISLGSRENEANFCIQFIVNQNMTDEDVTFAWEEIIAHL